MSLLPKMSLKPGLNPAPNAGKSKLVRKASPPRPQAEDTFRRKLEEIKKMRQLQSNQNFEKPKKKVVINGKPAMDVQGDWALFSSSSGKKYFFNLKTLTNQWTKPTDWIDENDAKNPPLPSSSVNVTSGISGAPPPPPPGPPPEFNGGENGKSFKMKIKKKRKNKNNQQNSSAQLSFDQQDFDEEEKDRLPKAYMDFSDSEDEKSAKLPKIEDSEYDEVNRLTAEPDTSADYHGTYENMEYKHDGNNGNSDQQSKDLSADPVPALTPQFQAVLAAKAMIESQLPPPSANPGEKNVIKSNQIIFREYERFKDVIMYLR